MRPDHDLAPSPHRSAFSLLPMSPAQESLSDTEEHEGGATTPRAAVFPSRDQLAAPQSDEDEDDARAPRSPRRRRTSGESAGRARKLSGNGRARKLSGEMRKVSAGEAGANGHGAGGAADGVRARKVSDSARTVTGTGNGTSESGAEMGDDEGYDDLLSAYESEDSSAHVH